MKIKALFHWITHSLDPALIDEEISLADLESEHKTYLQQRREALATIAERRQLAATNPSSQKTEKKFPSPLHTRKPFINIAQNQVDYSHFIDFCKLNLQENKNSSFYIALSYLLNLDKDKKPEDIDAKLVFLVGKLIISDKTRFMRFFSKNELLLRKYSTIMQEVEEQERADESLLLVKKEFDIFDHNLKLQEDALTVMSFSKGFIDNTEKYAAFVLWLISRQIPVQQIVESYLLHDFLKYNLSTLNSFNSEIRLLYRLLKQFPETHLLLEHLRTIGCGERGFLKYDLRGEQSEKQLELVEKKSFDLDFMQSEANFTALYGLFSQPFLAKAIVWAEQHPECLWASSLNVLLNDKDFLADNLAFILIALMEEKNASDLLKWLAELINNSIIKQLLASHNGVVLHLLKFKPQIFKHIEEEDLPKFIEQIQKDSTSIMDTMMQIFALYSGLLRYKKSSVAPIFDALMDFLPQQPQLLDDSNFIKQLKRCPGWSDKLANRAQIQHKMLIDCIETNTEDNFSSDSYHRIEDAWLQASAILRVIEQLKPKNSIIRFDKYALYAEIGKIYFRKHPADFNLENFINSFSLSEITPTENCLIERVLIELLVAIDNSEVRCQIIKKLESHPLNCQNWMTKNYHNDCLSVRAAQYGNVGLVRLLASKKQVNPRSLNKSIVIATEYQHWELATYLYATFIKKIKRETVGKIIILSAQNEALDFLKRVCAETPYRLNPKIFKKATSKAVKNNCLPIVQYLCQIPSWKPDNNLVEKLFKLAFEKRYFHIVAFLCDGLPQDRRPYIVHINHALRNAIIADDLESVSCLTTLVNTQVDLTQLKNGLRLAASIGSLKLVMHLMSLKTVNFTFALISAAMIEAVTHDHIAVFSYLLDFLIKDLKHEEPITQCLRLAVAKDRLNIVKYICQLPHSAFISRAVGEGLLMVIRTNNVILLNFFCKELAVNQPTTSAASQALYAAVLKGSVKLVKPLCKYLSTVSQKTMEKSICSAIEKAIILAIKHKHSDIVFYLLELPKFTLRARFLKRAISEANRAGLESTRERLKVLLTDLKKDTNQELDKINDKQGSCSPKRGLTTFGVFRLRGSSDALTHQSNSYHFLHASH